jgi:tRNA modification GTPase
MESLAQGTVRQLTSSGRSAIAVIRLTGDLSQLDAPSSLFRAANHKRVVEQAVDAICFGVWGEPGEEVVLCRTGVDAVEVTCHGGAAAVARILEDAAGRGFRIEAAPTVAFFPETGRSFSEKKATDWRPLTQARTQRTAEILLEQASVWPQFMERLLQCPREEALGLIDNVLAWSEFGRHLTEPWIVVLCGRPNVGKSSLMNALAGFTRSIVSEQAGTTRDRVTLETAIDGWPIRITDTAGVRQTNDPIEQAGVEQSLSAIALADLAVIVLDASEPVQEEDRRLLEVPVSMSRP